MPEFTPTTEEVRKGYTAPRRCMVTRREGGETLGSWLMRQNAVSQRDLNDFSDGAFDRWLAAHDREVAARTVDAVAHDLAEPRALWWSNLYGPQVQTDEATGAKLSLDEWFAARAAALRSGTEGSTDV